MAISFAGGTDRIFYGTGYNTTGTATCWLRSSSATAISAFLSVWDDSSNNGFGLVLNYTSHAGNLRAVGFDSGGVPRIDLYSTTTINDGNWHHAAFSWNSANGGANALYIDGASEATGNSSASWAQSAVASLYLGDNNDSAWASYTGELAEVAIWHGAQLDAAQIAALAKGFNPSSVKMSPTTGRFYAPLVRDTHNKVDSFFGGLTGTTVTDHPRAVGGTI